jgi:hypothetical protein
VSAVATALDAFSEWLCAAANSPATTAPGSYYVPRRGPTTAGGAIRDVVSSALM